MTNSRWLTFGLLFLGSLIVSFKWFRTRHSGSLGKSGKFGNDGISIVRRPSTLLVVLFWVVVLIYLIGILVIPA